MEKGKLLKGSGFSVTDQYPPEIMKRRRLLYPVMTAARNEHKKTRLFMDKLYVEGELFRDSAITYWLSGGDGKTTTNQSDDLFAAATYNV